MTDEIKYKVLLEYVEFSSKLMLVKSLTAKDEKKEHDYFTAAAALYSVVQIGRGNKSLLQAVEEMSRPTSKLIHDMPLPFDKLPFDE